MKLLLYSLNIYDLVAMLAWLFLALAYLFIQRNKRAMHVAFAILGIVVDISLVLYLQITRDAIGKALNENYTLLQYSHIIASSLALLLYFPILYLGVFLLFKRNYLTIRFLHSKLAKTALFFRTIGFLLMPLMN